MQQELINLRKKELQELAGTKKKQAIKDWLGFIGVNYIPDAKGFPKVSREVIISKLKGNTNLPFERNQKGDEEALLETMGVK